MIDLGLVLARFLHYAAVTTLFGVSFFPLYAHRNAEPNLLLRWRLGVLLVAMVASLASGLVWFFFSVANMSGNIADVVDADVLWAVVNDTRFGRIWTTRLILSIIMIGLLCGRLVSKFRRGRDLIAPI